MTYLIALFVPPLYFAMKKRWVGFIVTSLLLFLSMIFLITVVLAPGAFFLWFCCAICAVWHLRKEVVREHSRIFAEELVGKMSQANAALPPLTPGTSPSVAHP